MLACCWPGIENYLSVIKWHLDWFSYAIVYRTVLVFIFGRFVIALVRVKWCSPYSITRSARCWWMSHGCSFKELPRVVNWEVRHSIILKLKRPYLCHVCGLMQLILTFFLTRDAHGNGECPKTRCAQAYTRSLHILVVKSAREGWPSSATGNLKLESWNENKQPLSWVSWP